MSPATYLEKQGASPSPAMVPKPLDLATHFQRFIKYWAGAEVEYLGRAAGDSAVMPVELSVRWTGTVSGTLVIRCHPEFLSWLVENRDDKTLDHRSPGEIFQEIATLYCVYLIQEFWLDEMFELGPILPRPSTAGDWPAREPNAACVLQAGQNPVEIRLWMD